MGTPLFQLATVSLRPETAEDAAFLRDLYLATRDDEEGYRDLDPAERTALLERQFAWQHAEYRAAFPQAWFTIVTVDGKPAGRLYLARQPEEFRVVELALLPRFRGHGIGTQLLQSVQAEATRTQLPIRLHVAAGSPARAFYDRLGFTAIAVGPMRVLMEWKPPRPPGP